jgi:C4-dicarboxylate transporter, DctQ subunit
MLDRLEGWIIAGLAMAGFAVYMYGVIARYVIPAIAPDWTEEVTVYLLLWAMLLGGGQLVKRDRHLTSGVMHVLVAKPVVQRLNQIGMVLATVFAVIMVKQGIDLVEFDAMLNDRSRSSLQLSIAWVHVILPLAMGLIALRYVERLCRAWFGKGDSSP